eukprot:scaffold313286_cov10-Tisochrysis_lutea.AAC.1
MKRARLKAQELRWNGKPGKLSLKGASPGAPLHRACKTTRSSLVGPQLPTCACSRVVRWWFG